MEQGCCDFGAPSVGLLAKLRESKSYGATLLRCLSSAALGVCLFVVLCLGGLLLLWVCLGGGRSSGLDCNVEPSLKA